MKELTLKNVEQIKDDVYYGYMTFGEYLELIKKEIISLPEITDGYHRFESLTKSKAKILNNNEYMKEIIGFTVNLFINNDKSSIKLEDKILFIQAESINLLDGLSTTYIISKLDKRFMDSNLIIRIHTGSIDKAKVLVMALNSQIIGKTETSIPIDYERIKEITEELKPEVNKLYNGTKK